MRADALSDLHPMADLLARCPGMTKEHVYYTEQLELVEAIWRYRQAGIPPREAYRRALREQQQGQLSIWPDEAPEG